MDNFKLITPVAFIIFNRPDTTAKVFEQIRLAKPPKLLVIADGPRETRTGEAEKCAHTRAIIDTVDWNCEVLTNYSEVNLGCKRRVSSGLDWVFQMVEEAIVLEDDCMPDPTFFQFCQEMLEKYRTDDRIMMISGDNFQFGRHQTEYSYYFSRYVHIWGWATWRRSWQCYDVDVKMWPEIRDNNLLNNIFGTIGGRKFWHKILQRTYEGKSDTWDYQLAFASIIRNKLNIMPNVNLISNIGFGPCATHAVKINHLSAIPTEPISFPLKHPPFMIINQAADESTECDQFSKSPMRIVNKIKRQINNWLYSY